MIRRRQIPATYLAFVSEVTARYHGVRVRRTPPAPFTESAAVLTSHRGGAGDKLDVVKGCLRVYLQVNSASVMGLAPYGNPFDFGEHSSI